MHPSLRIVCLILLAAAIQFMPGWLLAATGAALAAAALAHDPRLLCRTLLRSRWLLLTLLLVYAFATPGVYVAGWPYHYAPTYEGIAGGALQAGRLAVMLTALALLLGTTARDDLVAGLYPLLLPLRLLGLRPERFAARLWLTLHYVEQAPPRTHGNPWVRLEQLAAARDTDEVERIRFSVPRYARRDWLVTAGLALLPLAWWLA